MVYLLLLFIMSISNYVKGCNLNVELIGFGSFDGEYVKINSSIYDGPENKYINKLFSNKTCNWEVASYTDLFTSYQCNECVNLIDCKIWNFISGNKTYLITGKIEKIRCINIHIFLYIFIPILFFIFSFIAYKYTESKRNQVNDVHILQNHIEPSQ